MRTQSRPFFFRYRMRRELFGSFEDASLNKIPFGFRVNIIYIGAVRAIYIFEEEKDEFFGCLHGF